MKFGIPTPAVTITDKTGFMKEPWYRFFANVQKFFWHSSDGSLGVSGTFTTADAKTVTVKDGVIVGIV